jgi:hypothetical protein
MELNKKKLPNFSLDNKDNTNYVFRLEGEETQEKTFIHPDILKEIADEENKKKEGNVNDKISSNKNKKKKKKTK